MLRLLSTTCVFCVFLFTTCTSDTPTLAEPLVSSETTESTYNNSSYRYSTTAYDAVDMGDRFQPLDVSFSDAGFSDADSLEMGFVDASVMPVLRTLDAGTMISGCQVFPANNPWNIDISDYPLNPNSDAIIANIQANGETTIKADFGSNPQYGIPYIVVAPSQPNVPINFVEYPSESDPGPYPVPNMAPIEFGNDHHVLVVQRGTCILYEMYHAVYINESNGSSRWNAGSGAIFNLSSNALRPLGWTSCDQAGLPIFVGLARYDEVAAGEIHHALRVTFNNTRNGWILPATHPGGNNDGNAPPMGMRLRLKASFDLSTFTGESRIILTALKRYGMFVADTGSNWYISGATDTRWNDSNLQQLNNVSGTSFEVVETGVMHQP